ncbi:hypothetical protein ACQP2T_15180 [Nonomuraea sp. CA-143628]|uniref:hypothetical protein n=1 Tax=Nonomuraea sp. CA-143628 TaxID=3239997 RepID=UPI003D91B538
MWDLITGEQVAGPLTGHEGMVCAVATAEIEGRPHVVTTGDDATVRLWDLSIRRPVGKPMRAYDSMRAVAMTAVDGRPHAITASASVAEVWDLTTREQVGRELIFPSGISALAVASDGRLVVGGGELVVLARR